MLAGMARRLAGKPPFFSVALLLATATLVLYVASAVMIFRHGGTSKDFGWTYEMRGSDCFVQTVAEDGPAFGLLQTDDRILAWSGDKIVALASPFYKMRAAQPGNTYSLRILRGSAEKEFLLPVKLKHSYADLGYSVFFSLLGFVICAIALLVGIAKPDSRPAQLVCITWTSVGLIRLASGLMPISGLLQGTDKAFCLALWLLSLDPLEGALGYHFNCSFPPDLPSGRLWRALKHIFYTWGAALGAAYAYFRIIHAKGDPTATYFFLQHRRFFDLCEIQYGLFFVIVILAVLALTVRNYRLVNEPGQRNRIKWFVYGGSTAILPVFLYWLIDFVLRSTGQTRWVASAPLSILWLFSNATLMMLPLSLAYVILKHQVFEINVVIRLGVQYLLAKNVLRLTLSLPLAGLIFAVLSNPNSTIADLVLHNTIFLALIVFAAASLRFRTRLTLWIDQKFFRQAYDRERILLELVEKVKGLTSMEEISRLVCAEVDEALHPKGVYLYYREGAKHDFALGYSSGGSLKQLRILEGSHLVRFLEQTPTPVEFPFPTHAALPEQETSWLSSLAIRLIVPIRSSDERLVGLLLMGERKSEEPFSKGDLKMLQALTSEIGLLYEMLWLKVEVDKERKIRHEVLAHLQERSVSPIKECPTCGACYDSLDQFCPIDRQELVFSLPVERVLDNKYRLERLIGKGGMGAVYQASDLRLDRKVAIKILLGSSFGDPAALRRFEREARASARLNHPHVITVYDYGGIGVKGAFLVMELLKGTSLRWEINRFGNIHPQVAASWFFQILEAIKAAHQAGVVHRDLKPENILVALKDDGSTAIKVLDFGLAKLRLPDKLDPSSLSFPGAIIGTPFYMSPEQITGGQVDERSDLFALGAMVIETLTGSHPFAGKNISEVILNILHTEVRFDDEALNQVLQKCLAKKLEDRYRSAAELQKDLIPAIRKCPPFPSPLSSDTSTKTVDL